MQLTEIWNFDYIYQWKLNLVKLHLVKWGLIQQFIWKKVTYTFLEIIKVKSIVTHKCFLTL